MVFLLGLLAFVACKERDEVSEVKIVHGIPISESKYPAVVLLRKEPSKYCSGTFIQSNPPTVLTASHCLPHLPATNDSHIGVSYKGIQAIAACVPRDASGKGGKLDIAAVIFPNSVVVPGVASFESKAPVEGLGFTIVGFGRNDAIPDTENPGSKVKRMGHNFIKRLISTADSERTGMIEFFGAPQGDMSSASISKELWRSTSAQGDSGGALFSGSGEPQTNLLGVCSEGSLSTDDKVKRSRYVNLKAPYLEAFIKAIKDQNFLNALARHQAPQDVAKICQVSSAVIPTEED